VKRRFNADGSRLDRSRSRNPSPAGRQRKSDNWKVPRDMLRQREGDVVND
jgi:hypothetical protein